MKNFSPYQTNIFNWIECGTGNGLVQARAGSGKTFTALHGMQFMKGNVISMTFNKKNAVELAMKITQLGLIHAKGATFHAEGLMNFKRVHNWFKVNASKVYFITEKFTPKPEQMKARNFIKSLVSLAKQAGFGIDTLPAINDVQAWFDLAMHHDISLDADMSYYEAIDIAIEVLKDSNRDIREIDFDDMIYLPLLNNMELIKYDWVIIDEAQDTNAVRKIMAVRMLKPTSRFLAIGDEAQSIYGFTGAENDSMNIIKDTFKCAEFELPICYRCGTNIIKSAQEIVPDIQAREDAPEGLIRSEKYEEFLNNAAGYTLSKADGIVCRNNAPLVALAFGLIRKGIGCRIEGKDIGKNLITLCNKWKVKDLNTFTERLVKFFDKEFAKANKVKMQLLEDKMETMIILIERCQSLGKHDVQSLKNLIESMFSDSDEPNVPNVVCLSSIHKAKGLEWERCFILGMSQFQPSKYAVQDWMIKQEQNLKYVAITRAMNELVHITDVPTRRNNPEE
jgi:DNA helicase-2/ATP-dependent DNA helicase PcrA